MGLLKVRKVAGTERSRFQLDFNMTGRLVIVKPEPAGLGRI